MYTSLLPSATSSSPLQPQRGVPHGEQPRLRPVRHHGGGRGRSVLGDAAGGGQEAQHQLSQHSQGTKPHTFSLQRPGAGGADRTVGGVQVSLSQAQQPGPSWLCLA